MPQNIMHKIWDIVQHTCEEIIIFSLFSLSLSLSLPPQTNKSMRIEGNGLCNIIKITMRHFSPIPRFKLLIALIVFLRGTCRKVILRLADSVVRHFMKELLSFSTIENKEQIR